MPHKNVDVSTKHIERRTSKAKLAKPGERRGPAGNSQLTLPFEMAELTSTAMRLFQRLGILLGSLHIVLYFLVSDYFSMLDKVVPPWIGIPFMFFCGYL